METICLILVLCPLVGALVAGFYPGPRINVVAQSVTIIGVLISFLLSCKVAYLVWGPEQASLSLNLYTWATGESFFPYTFHIGFLIDALTAMMLLVVTFVSLLVHVYSIGYMAGDEGYARFFSYISLFTFMMLMLVTSNNFLQLFFGWEGVGLVSYLLIGFWFHRESALQGSLKAFLVNRVGDFGFILGIGLILAFVGSLDYATVFRQAVSLQHMAVTSGGELSALTAICLLLFVGAMGKSAQVPLHVWLPESMEGPTPISALIHAATMVTAGVFMVARLSPLMEYSETSLSVILVIGGTGALFTGILALVMNDIKRVVAYSTLSQLGYMMVAMGASAYSTGIFHLATHACFKALLFLGAGSVILGMHHEQDMRHMGGLYRKMPITYVTFLIGTLALCALPPFSGFYSKDMIVDLVKSATVPGHVYAYYCVLIGAMITALYSFRALLMTFHGRPRMTASTFDHVHESSWVVWLPLVLLAIPSVLLGWFLIEPLLLSKTPLLAQAIFVLPAHAKGLHEIAHEVAGPLAFIALGVQGPVFWLTLFGIALAYLAYVFYPALPKLLALRFHGIYWILTNKYGFDALNDRLFVRGANQVGQLCYHKGDQQLIDGALVNGTANTLREVALKLRRLQTGYLFHYTAVMVIGIFGFLGWYY